MSTNTSLMTPNQKTMSEIVLFLDNKGANHSGRTLCDVLNMRNEELEDQHDYIQWLFPLKEPSQFAVDSPTLNDSDIKQIKANPNIQANLRTGLETMTSFYINNHHWLCEHDHNHLRITRIIKSLILLVGIDEAEHFYDTIIDLVTHSKNKVSPENIKYWTDALGLPTR